MAEGSRQGALTRAERCYDEGAFLDALRRLVAIPTESQIPERMPDLRRYCTEAMPALVEGMGFTHHVYENPLAAHGPVYVGTRIEDPALPTVLLYGHGDVVRGLAGRWTGGLDPWAVTVQGEKWYGRGTVDNKGQHLIAIEALRAVMAERGGKLGFNVKLLIETGEEVGSPGLRDILRANRDALGGDVFFALDGPRQTTFMPELKLGSRGGISFDLVVKLREGAHHSGHWGGVLADPGFVLTHALTTIVSREGRILVDGWTPRQVPPSVNAAIDALIFEDIPGIPEADPNWGEPGLSKARRIFGWTSVIMLAQITGHPDAPTNAVQEEARARLQIRHTADVPGPSFLPALRKHLDEKGFPMVEIRPVTEQAAFGAARTDPENPWVKMAIASVSETAGRAPNVIPNSSGSNPSDMFIEELDMPVIWIPNSYAGCNQHGPDEHAMAPLLREGLRLLSGIWWDIGAGAAPRRGRYPAGITGNRM